MDERDLLAQRFEENRGHLRAVAYRLLGSLTEADDAVIRSRESRREEPVGVHLPDPIVSRVDGVDPEDEALLADSVGLALHVVLEALSPPERVAFVLHDMFAVPFDDIAPIVARTPTATRKLASRARRRVWTSWPIPSGCGGSTSRSWKTDRPETGRRAPVAPTPGDPGTIPPDPSSRKGSNFTAG